MSVPPTLVFQPSSGCISSNGRCFNAAAWNTTSGRAHAKDLVDARGVTDVSEDQAVVVEHRPTLDRQLGAVQTTLVTIEHEQLRRLETGQLTAQLTTDRTTRTGHQHPPAGDVAGNGVGVDVGRMATEQVRLVHRPDVALPHHRRATDRPAATRASSGWRRRPTPGRGG